MLELLQTPLEILIFVQQSFLSRVWQPDIKGFVQFLMLVPHFVLLQSSVILILLGRFLTILWRSWVHSLNYVIIPRNDFVPFLDLNLHFLSLEFLHLLHVLLGLEQFLNWFLHHLFAVLSPHYFNLNITHHFLLFVQKGSLDLFLDVCITSFHGTLRIKRSEWPSWLISAEDWSIWGWHVVNSRLKIRYRTRTWHLSVNHTHIMHVTALILIQRTIKYPLSLV